MLLLALYFKELLKNLSSFFGLKNLEQNEDVRDMVDYIFLQPTMTRTNFRHILNSLLFKLQKK